MIIPRTKPKKTMQTMVKLEKLKKGDKVAILFPSFAAPGKYPWVYELGIQRLKEIFGLEPVEFPTTKKMGASTEERSADLIAAFSDTSIKAVIASIGGDDQITYIKNLPSSPFANNPKPFFGFSDNTHFMNFLWLHGIPSYYGGGLMTQLAMQKRMDDFTVEYLEQALFEGGEIELKESPQYNDMGLNWKDPANLDKERIYEANDGWVWDGNLNADGISWGGCLESIDELLRHGLGVVGMPSLNDFESIILFTETSEEIPDASYVMRVYRALGERGVLSRVQAIMVGRPKAWEFGKQNDGEQKAAYRKEQRDIVLDTIRRYNPTVPVIQNMDFGHTDPQIPLPFGRRIKVNSTNRKIFADF